MAEPDDDVQGWFDGLSYKLKRDLAAAIKQEAEGLADAIKAEAPVKTGALRDSVQVRRRRNELELEVTAGGDATTREIRAGSGEGYDYALSLEYGTVKAPAEPFFFNTARERMPEIRQNIEDAVSDVVSRS